MTLKQLSAKLRHAANILDDLVGSGVERLTLNETPQTADKIRKTFKKRGRYKKRKKLHWSQTPEGKRKLRANGKKQWRKRKQAEHEA